ncbi:MAG: hypothetical protein HC876_22585 [Chloroflexaceae bacterium]|nr:hypothetical protein [bacterium]NJO08078.1 hypothetical protein [Chloroflexaceae bacterium]
MSDEQEQPPKDVHGTANVTGDNWGIVVGVNMGTINIIRKPTRYKYDMTTKTKKQFLELVQNGDYSIQEVKEYLLNSTEEIQIRLRTLEIYLTVGEHDYSVLSALGKDISQNMREGVLRSIIDYKLLDYPHDMLVLNMQDRKKTIAEQAVRSVDFLIKHRTAHPKLFLVANIPYHPYWLIRKLAVQSIISADLQESIELLCKFKHSKYWVTRRKILDYVEKRHAQDRLTEDDTRIAVDILEYYIHDEESSSNKTRQLAQSILERITHN